MLRKKGNAQRSAQAKFPVASKSRYDRENEKKKEKNVVAVSVISRIALF